MLIELFLPSYNERVLPGKSKTDQIVHCEFMVVVLQLNAEIINPEVKKQQAVMLIEELLCSKNYITLYTKQHTI